MRKSFVVLLVEDSTDDIEFVRQAFAEIKEHKVSLETVTVGKRAIDILLTPTIKPHFILLDWNLPDMTGADVLKEIKGSLAIKKIPVFIFTTSKIRKDIETAYGSHCTAYIHKPLQYDELVGTLRDILNFLSRATLPRSN